MATYEPLHHKYRPQTFADLVGQSAIADTLTHAIKRQRIAPAYLFTGPRGTGKTSSARILAKSLNCLGSPVPTPMPCGKCDVCRAITLGSALDVIEIDAASNTGVDNIREIIERSQFAPVQCRYKVYVIDECHMLSVAAFNALLKTIEEPPDRVIFVLATTDPQRVLPTIISRCQRFDYRRIPLTEMVNHLHYIAQKETIDITPEALNLVAQIANGGLRDAESLLDQLSLGSDTITPEKVWDLVGAVPEQDLLKLLQAIQSNQATEVLAHCRHLMNRGREPLVVLQNLAGFYLNLLIAKSAPHCPEMVAVTAPTWEVLCQEAQQWTLETILRGQKYLKDSELQLKNTTQPRLWLEVTLLSLLPSALTVTSVQSTQISTKSPESTVSVVSSAPPSPQPATTVSSIATSSPPSHNGKNPSAIPLPEATKPIPEPVDYSEDLAQIWQALLSHLPPFTAGLMQRQGHLIEVQKTVARLGIQNESFLKLAKDKIGELETALEKVCRRKIKVHVHVFSLPSPTSEEAPIPAKTDSSNSVSFSTKTVKTEALSHPVEPSSREAINDQTSPINTASAPIENVNIQLLEDKTVPPSYEEVKSQVLSHKIDCNSAMASSVAFDHPPVTEADLEESDFTEKEIEQAAERFAKMFEGDVIDMNNGGDETEVKINLKTEQECSTTTLKEIAHELPNQSVQTVNTSLDKPMIKGRPPTLDIDEENIPF